VRPILMHLLAKIQKCQYYSSFDILHFADLMTVDELEAYVLARNRVLPPEDRHKILKAAKSFLPR
jgi:hypothetical protein